LCRSTADEGGFFKFFRRPANPGYDEAGAQMNVRASQDLRGRVVLAHQVPFHLGALTVDPAMRQVTHEDGRKEILEQRVMQVFVALARAKGDILSRDDLIACCWHGRIVGDDAINRVMSRLRRVTEHIGEGVFRVETITKVGYRLVAGADAEGPTTSAAPARKRRLQRTLLVLALALVLLGIAAAALWFGRGAASTPTSVAVIAEGGGAQDRALARDLASDLSELAGARPAQLVVVDGGRASAADYVVRIGSEHPPGRVQFGLTLTSRIGGELLWSTRFNRPGDERAELRPQAAAKLGYVLLCATEATAAEGDRMDSVTLRSYLAVCDQIHDDPDSRVLALAREITERAPRFAHGWAMRAYAEAYLGGLNEAPHDSPQKQALRARARTHIRRARALDARIGYTFLAESLLVTPPDRWGDRLAVLERGIAAVPDFAALHDYRAAELLNVGRLGDAVASARLAVTLDPLAPAQRQTLIRALGSAGEVGAARAEVNRLSRMWPDSFYARLARQTFEARYGDPRRALQSLDDIDNGRLRSPGASPYMRLFLEARISRSPAAVDAMARAFAAALRSHPDWVWYVLQSFGEFGLVDESYRQVVEPETLGPLQWASETLFRPQMRAFRRDTRFMPLANRLGLVRYWHSSGQWPDFCAEPELPYNCRAEARRLLGGQR
jgi:DNA-binding winged helix-turn-helix (wHTH) protein